MLDDWILFNSGLASVIMSTKTTKKISRRRTVNSSPKAPTAYTVEEQVGFLLRRAHQKSSSIFQSVFPDRHLTPLQFTALVKIRDEGSVSQNRLGRLSHMDPATVMGVISRLEARNLIRKSADKTDKRKIELMLTAKGLKLIESLEGAAHQVSVDTLAPLTRSEQKMFLQLLTRLT